MKAVVLFSGGIDSLAALVYARETYGPQNVLAVYCDVGQKYAEKEIVAVEYICAQFGSGHLKQEYKIERRLQLGDFEDPDDPNAIIPYRNSFFILLGAINLPPEGGHVLTQNLVVGESSTWDRRPEFNESMNDLLKVADPRRVELFAPHMGKTKTEILKYLKQKVDYDLIHNTIGCYSPSLHNCGGCKSCFRSYVAMVNADIPNIHKRFKNHPLDWHDGIKKYVQDMVSGKYEQVRVDDTFRALAKMEVLEDYLGKIYAVDLDGVLADTGIEKFSDDMTIENVQSAYRNAKPIQQRINRVNYRYEHGDVIIIHTARYEEDRELTEKWLSDHGVKYHRLVLGKIRADRYIDDRNMSIDEF